MSGFTLWVCGTERKIHIYVDGELQNSADAVGQPWILLKPSTSARMRAVITVREDVIGAESLMKLSSLMCRSPPDEIKALGSGIEGVLAVDAAGKNSYHLG